MRRLVFPGLDAVDREPLELRNGNAHGLPAAHPGIEPKLVEKIVARMRAVGLLGDEEDVHPLGLVHLVREVEMRIGMDRE